MIPNHIHFIFFGLTDFFYIHYLAIKTAALVHKPDKIFLHYYNAPQNNPLWDDILQYVELNYIVPPEEYKGIKLEWYQYKADITRLEILIEQGGIYLDIDLLSMNDISRLLHHKCVLSVETAEDFYTTDLNKVHSITNAVLMCEPGHPMMVEWLEKTAENIAGKPWAYHAVTLPVDIAKNYTNGEIHIEPGKSFMPFDFRTDWVFHNNNEKYEWVKSSYGMHLWETIWYQPFLKQIDSRYMLEQDNVFTKLFRDYSFNIANVEKNEKSLNYSLDN